MKKIDEIKEPGILFKFKEEDFRIGFRTVKEASDKSAIIGVLPGVVHSVEGNCAYMVIGKDTEVNNTVKLAIKVNLSLQHIIPISIETVTSLTYDAKLDSGWQIKIIRSGKILGILRHKGHDEIGKLNFVFEDSAEPVTMKDHEKVLNEIAVKCSRFCSMIEGGTFEKGVKGSYTASEVNLN